MLAQAHARKATGGPEGAGAGDQGRAVTHALSSEEGIGTVTRLLTLP